MKPGMMYLVSPNRTLMIISYKFGLGKIDVWSLTIIHYSHTLLTTNEIGAKFGITNKKPELMEKLHRSIEKLKTRGYITATTHNPPKYQLTKDGLDKYIEIIGAVETIINKYIKL